MKNILTNKWFKFSLVLIIYLLWAYWVGSWWLLILVPVIFDIYLGFILMSIMEKVQVRCLI